MKSKLRPLQCRTRSGDNSDQKVVFLHGFGADASDLFPLADFLDPDGEWDFYFPEAPLEVPIGPMSSGRGWFPISLRDLEQGVDFTTLRPPGLDDSAQLLQDLLFELNAKRLVLGGFSQGAMVATDVALASPEDVHGLVIWSGCLLDHVHWAQKAKNWMGRSILQSHGSGDPVLPFAAAVKLNEMFKSAGADVPLLAFGGGHEIPAPVLQKTKDYLRASFHGQS